MKPQKIAYISAAVIILLFIISLISYIYLLQHNTANTDLYAVIYQDGTPIKKINIQKISQPYTITITGDNNRYNVIQIRNNSIGIIESSCPDKTCVHMGFTHKSYFPLICLPNHLLVQLESKDTGSSILGTEFDDVVY